MAAANTHQHRHYQPYISYDPAYGKCNPLLKPYQEQYLQPRHDRKERRKNRNPILAEDSMVVIISQSGETADSLAALRLAKERNVPVLSVVNVVGSSIARESDYTLYTYAGPEFSVITSLVNSSVSGRGMRAPGAISKRRPQKSVYPKMY